MKQFIEIKDSIRVEILQYENGNTYVDGELVRPFLEVLYEKGFEISSLLITSLYTIYSAFTLVTAKLEDYELTFYFNYDASKLTDIALHDFINNNCPIYNSEAINYLLDKGLINKKLFFNLDFLDWL